MASKDQIVDPRRLFTEQYREYTSRPQIFSADFDVLEIAERLAENGYIGRYAAFASRLVHRDPILKALYNQRIDTVTRRWAVAPGGEAPIDLAAYELVVEAVKALRLDWAKLLRQCATAKPYGWALCEIDWGYDAKGRIWPFSVRPVYHYLFECAVPGNPRVPGAVIDEPILVLDGAMQRLIPQRWILCSPECEDPLPLRGLLRPSLLHVLRKLRAEGNWTTYDDRAGLPLLLLNYQGAEMESMPPEIEAAYKQIIEHLGEAGGAAVFKTEATVIQPNAISDSVGPGAVVNNVIEQLTILWLGGALVTSSGGNGSYAQASVHADRLYESLSTQAEDIERCIEYQFFRRILDYNGLSAAATPKLTLRPTPDLAPKLLLEMALFLTQLGLPVDERQIRELTGLVAPTNGRGVMPPRPQGSDEKAS